MALGFVVIALPLVSQPRGKKPDKNCSCALRFPRPPICAGLTSVGVATGCGPARHKTARRATQPRRRAYTGPPPPIPRGQHQAAQWGAGGLPGWGPPSPLSPPPQHTRHRAFGPRPRRCNTLGLRPKPRWGRRPQAPAQEPSRMAKNAG